MTRVVGMLIGGLVGIVVLGGLWALRMVGWLAALGAGMALLLALVLIHTPAGWAALQFGLECMAVVAVTELLPMLLIGDHSRNPGRGV